MPTPLRRTAELALHKAKGGPSAVARRESERAIAALFDSEDIDAIVTTIEPSDLLGRGLAGFLGFRRDQGPSEPTHLCSRRYVLTRHAWTAHAELFL